MKIYYNSVTSNLKLLFAATFLVGSLTVNAQINYETNESGEYETNSGIGIGLPGGEDDIDDETPPAPIDGFLTIGLIAGAAIGFRKHLKKSKE